VTGRRLFTLGGGCLWLWVGGGLHKIKPARRPGFGAQGESQMPIYACKTFAPLAQSVRRLLLKWVLFLCEGGGLAVCRSCRAELHELLRAYLRGCVTLGTFSSRYKPTLLDQRLKTAGLYTASQPHVTTLVGTTLPSGPTSGIGFSTFSARPSVWHQ
jgi:hypothetical protein